MEEEKNAFTISFTLRKDKSEFMAVFIFFLKSCIFIFKASLFFYSLSKTSQVPPKWVSARAYLPRKFWRVLKVLPLLIHSCVCVCVWGGVRWQDSWPRAQAPWAQAPRAGPGVSPDPGAWYFKGPHVGTPSSAPCVARGLAPKPPGSPPGHSSTSWVLLPA